MNATTPKIEAAREALIAFWRIDGCGQRAENLSRGYPLDELDARIVEAVNAYNVADRKLAA